jgi:hypothetical protein
VCLVWWGYTFWIVPLRIRRPRSLLWQLYRNVRGVKTVEAGLGVIEGTYSPQWVQQFHVLNIDVVRSIVEEIERAHHVQIEFEAALGAYMGYVEPSYKFKVTGKMRHILGATSHWSHGHSQKTMRLIFPYEGAGGFYFNINLTEKGYLVSERLENFTNSLRLRGLSATLTGTIDQPGKIRRVLCWGKLDTDDSDAIKFGLAFARISTPGDVQEMMFRREFQVLDVREGEYHWYIKESTSKENVKRGEYLGRYSLPPLP